MNFLEVHPFFDDQFQESIHCSSRAKPTRPTIRIIIFPGQPGFLRLKGVMKAAAVRISRMGQRIWKEMLKKLAKAIKMGRISAEVVTGIPRYFSLPWSSLS